MFAHNFIYISSGVILLLLCISEANGINKGPLNQCAKWNFICDPHSLQPCCNSTLSCKLKESRNDFYCGEITKLGASCTFDEDCNEIKHAKCTEKKCVCREKNLRLNATYCAPILGGFCWRNEPCVTKNALCIDNECRCKENYSESEDQCLPVIANLHCNSYEDCARIRFAKCSERNYCICSLNTVIKTNSSCEPLLDIYCAKDSDCLVDNSVCNNNKCQCLSNYVTFKDNQCVQPYYMGMSCTNDLSCNFYMKHTVCSPEKKCVCSSNYYHYNRTVHSLFFNMSTNDEECRAKQVFCLDNKCYHHSVAGFSDKSCSKDKNCFGSLLGELCDSDEDCFPYNSVCSDNECKCAMNYRNISTFSCLPNMLNQICWSSSHCSAIPNAECLDHRCTCKKGYARNNVSTCLSLIGSQCTKHDDCDVPHSLCFDKQCECSDYFIRQSNDQCRSQFLRKTCEIEYDCKNIKFSYCSSYKTCSCTENKIAVNGSKCGVRLNQYCSDFLPCGVENSVCIENKCKCKPYFGNSDGKCLPRRLEESCDNDRDCNLIKYAKCDANKQCSCLHNYISMNGTLCLALLYEYCYIDDDCYTRNSRCIDSQCQCRDRFVATDFNTRCESTTLGRRCRSSKDCSMIENSICSSDKICICPSNYMALGSYFCAPTINEACNNDIHCFNDYFYCLNGKCQCKDGYTAISADRCMPNDLMYTCEKITDCNDSWHWKCDNNQQCVCQQNNTAISHTTCLPSLNGFCWRDDQCVTENSICKDFRCQCKPYFIAVANNYCEFQGE